MKTRTLLMFVALAVFALPSFAQFESEPTIMPVEEDSGAYDLGTYMENPCTAGDDWVLVDYDVYLYQAFYDDSGRYLFDEDTAMTGSDGQTTYAAAGSTQSDVGYTAPFTLRKYHKVNTSDNFHVVTVIDFDPSSRWTSLSVETACGNGMPDSAE